MKKMVFIQSARLAGHFRAGRKFTREGGVFTVDAFTEKEWAAIRSDAFLVVRDAEPADDVLPDGVVVTLNQTEVGELVSLSTSTSTVLSTTDSAVASLSTATKSTTAKATGAKAASVKK